MAVAEKYPQYTNGIAVYSKNEKNSYCYICPNKLPIASEEHLKNSDHLSTLAYYLQNFTDNGPFVSCKLCSVWLEYSSIKEHAITHKLMPWYRPEVEFKIFYVNWISSKNNEYYCHLCNVKLSSWFHAIFHTEKTEHRALRGDKINEAAIRNLPFSWSHYKEVGHLASFMGTSEASMCALCCVPSGTLHNEILKHTEDIIHIRNEEAFKEALKKAPIHVPPITGSFDYNYYSNRVDDSAVNNSDEGMMQISLSFCIVCHKVIDSGRIEEHLATHGDLSDSSDNAREDSRKNGGCDVVGKNKAIFQNISFPINQKMKPCKILPEKNETDDAKEDNYHQCSCSMKLCSDEDLRLEHKILRKSDQFRVRRIDRECKTSISSQSKAHDLLPKQDTDAGENSLLPEGIHYLFPVYKCTLCDYDIGERINIKSHIDTPHHQSNLQLQSENEGKIPNNNELKSSLKNSSETSADGEPKVENETDVGELPEGINYSHPFYKCTLCGLDLIGKIDMECHIENPYHQTKLRFLRKSEVKISTNNGSKSKPEDLPKTSTDERAKVENDANAEGLPEGVLFLFNSTYRCTLCKCHLCGKVNIQAHVDTARHQKKLRLWREENAKILGISADAAPIITKNDQPLPRDVVMTDNPNFFWCKTCSLQISGYKCTIQHIKGVNHKNNKLGLSTSTSNISSNSSKSNSKIDSNEALGSTKTAKETLKNSDSEKKNVQSLPSSSIAQVNCSPAQHVNVKENETATKNKKRPRTRGKKKVIDTANIVTASIQKIQQAVEIPSSSVNKIEACEIYPEKKKSPGKDNSFKCDSCNIKLRGYAELLSHVMSDECKSSTTEEVNELESYKFAETLPGKLKITRFVGGKKVEAVDIPEIFMRITNTNYYCLSCCCNLNGGESIFKHVKTVVHGKNVMKNNEEDKGINKSAVIDGKTGLLENSVDVQKLPPHIVATAEEDVYWCQLCSVQIHSYKNIFDHENGLKHKENMNPVDLTFDQSLYPDITVIPKKRNEFWCKVCSVRICGPKTVVQHVNAPKHMQQVKDSLNLPGVSDKRTGESIPITADGINRKINDYLSLSSTSPEKYELPNGKRSLDSIAGHNDGKLNNNRELMRESVKSIHSPGDEVFMTECRICKEVILGDSQSVTEHVNSKRHEEKREFVSYLQGPEFVLEMEPKLNKHDEFKYFIADKQVEGDESVTDVVEVPKGATKDFGICFTWCSACCVKIYDDFRLNEHLKSPFHLNNFKGKFIICKTFDGNDDNDDLESNEKDQHKNYPEGIMEIHGEDYLLCTICNGVKLFDKNSVFEHVESLVHLNNLQRSLESGKTEEYDVFFNESNWKTSEKSAEGEETTAQSLFRNSQSKNAEGSTSENDFFSCSSAEDSKINAGPSEAQMVTSMAQMNLNSEENEKVWQDTEFPFSEGSCSSLSYGQRDEDDWIQLCPGSDGSVDYYRMGDEYVELDDEFSVSESASTSQTSEIASTSQIPKNIRVPEKQTAVPLGETYNIEGTDLWVCLVCHNYQVYSTKMISSHLTSIQHANWRTKKSFIAPKPLNNTNFIISRKFQSEGIVAIPTKTFAVCTFCSCKVTTEAKANEHISTAKHRAEKMKVINEKKKLTLNSSVPFSRQPVLPDGIEKFANKDFLLCTICRKKLLQSEIKEHIRDFKHINNGKTLIVKINEDEFRCKRCGIILSGYLALVNHLNTSEHNNIPDPPKKNLNSWKTTNMVDQEKTKCHIFMKKLKKNPQKVYDDLKSKKNIPNFIKILPQGILMIERINTKWCMTCNCFLSSRDWKRHSFERRHKEILERNELLNQRDNQIFYCELCRRHVIGKVSWELHTLFAEHKRNERALLEASSAEASDKASVESPRRIQPMISNFQLAESDNSLKEGETSGSRKPGGAKIPQKYQAMVDCNICHCKVPGGDANISNHRNSRKHKDNEAKLFAKPIASADTGNSVGNVSVNPRSFNAIIPLDAYSQYHYRNDSSIDFIECKVCNLNIHGIGAISANYVYAFHMQSEVHKMKEIGFAKKWRPSPAPSTSGSQSSLKSSKSSDKSSSKKKDLTKKRGLRRSGALKLLPKFDGKRAICPMCHQILESKNLLHSHMTSHFWTRFTENPPPITEKAPEKPAKSEPSRCTEDSDEELVINESPMKPLKRRQFRRRPLDIEVTDSANIYEIDKQKMSEIKAGVLLSLSKDKDTIYCLICRCNVSNNLQTFYEHLCSVKHLDYLKDMLDDDKLFQNSENQFSDLALGYEYMEDISKTAVKCHACDISVNNKFSKLHKHINSARHIDKWTALDENSRELFRGLKSKMECDFLSVKWYWCVICNLKFITECEFQKHLMRRKHLKKIQKFGDQFLMFDYCRVCASLWYGFLKTFSYHSDCKMHKYHKLDGFFSINQLPESAERLVNSAEEEIGDILRDLECRRAIDKIKEDQLLCDLREIVVAKYPNAIAHPFGSRITGLGGKISDLDVFIDCPTQKSCMYFGENSHPELIERRLVKIEESLENNTNIWHIDREILDCRIPIIKAKHKPTDIECDLSFTNGLTVENTALIKNYCDKSTDCRKLIIFIKNWMNHCELSGANGINSYGIAWLVIYFLQTTKILPTVNQLIQMNDKSQMIAGWETGVSKDFQVQIFAGSFEELLNEFFKFYGNFDYRHDVICPLLGEIVKKIDFQHRGKLPSTMGPYLNYLYDTGDAEPFRVDSIMCLQDPFDLAHNITKAVTKFHIYKFKTFCCYSAEILDNNR